MIGRQQANRSRPPRESPRRILVNAGTGSPKNITPNRETANSAHSPYLHFARLLKQQLNHPIGLVQTALGGSALAPWNPAESREMVVTSEHGRVEESCDTVYNAGTGIAEITHHYRFLDKAAERVGHTRLRFIAQNQLADLIAVAGLTPRVWYGNWDRSPCAPTAPEIIIVAGLK